MSQVPQKLPSLIQEEKTYIETDVLKYRDP
jgi:hypothetical protein